MTNCTFETKIRKGFINDIIKALEKSSKYHGYTYEFNILKPGIFMSTVSLSITTEYSWEAEKFSSNFGTLIYLDSFLILRL